MSKKYTLWTFKGICMNFLLELKFFMLSHPVTSKKPHKIVQIHMRHPVCNRLKSSLLKVNDETWKLEYKITVKN